MRRILIFIPLLLQLCGCRTQYVPVESVHKEFRDRANELRVTDSVTSERIVYVKGDTIYIQQWKDRYRTVTVRDTIRTERTDTIRIPYPVERTVETERKRPWWETTLMWIGAIMAVSGTILLSLRYSKRVTKLHTH